MSILRGTLGASDGLKVPPVARLERPYPSPEQLLWVPPKLPVEPGPATGLMRPLYGGTMGAKAWKLGS